MNLTEARLLSLQGVLHVPTANPGSTYGDDLVDRAIQFAGDYLVNETFCVTQSDNHAVSTNDQTFTLNAVTFDGFQTAFLEHCRIGLHDVTRADSHWCQRWLQANPAAGRPTHIGFETPSSGFLYPKADQAYTLAVVWHPPFTQWEPGFDVGTSDLELNIPDRFIRPAFWYGVGSAIVYGETQNLWASTGWQRFIEYVEEVKKMCVIDAPTSDQLIQAAGRDNTNQVNTPRRRVNTAQFTGR